MAGCRPGRTFPFKTLIISCRKLCLRQEWPKQFMIVLGSRGATAVQVQNITLHLRIHQGNTANANLRSQQINRSRCHCRISMVHPRSSMVWMSLPCGSRESPIYCPIRTFTFGHIISIKVIAGYIADFFSSRAHPYALDVGTEIIL